jgi:hypothetical protein
MEEYSIHQHIRLFLGRRINKMNRECAEICLLIKAGTAVTNKKATTSDDLNARMLKKYMFIRTYRVGVSIDVLHHKSNRC